MNTRSSSVVEMVTALSSDDDTLPAKSEEQVKSESSDHVVNKPTVSADGSAHEPKMMVVFRRIENAVAMIADTVFLLNTRDPARSSTLLYACGLMTGGIAGLNMSAFGIGCAVQLFDVDNLRISAIAIALIISAAYAEQSFELVGFFQVGNMITRIGANRQCPPDIASGLTAGIICSLAPSKILAVWIFCVHAFSVVRGLNKKNIWH